MSNATRDPHAYHLGMADGAGDREVPATYRETTAYEGVDDLDSFGDRTSIDRYRADRLRRTAPQADCLAERMSPGRILEVACGNGRLLLEFARRDGRPSLGIDVAASRVAFAREWAREARYGDTEFALGDALDYPLQTGSFVAALCITGAFAYFEAAAPGAAALLARRLNDALEPGGLLCLELYPHPGYRRLLEAVGGEARIWNELPPDDPWRFYLSRLSLDDSGVILRHDKTFIHRATGEVDSGREEHLYLYSEEGITEVLDTAGFHEVTLYEEWGGKRYRGGEVMVVTARKPTVA
jgi:SAM-dependent methyltransferase